MKHTVARREKNSLQDIPSKTYRLIVKNIPICTVDILFFSHTSPYQTLLCKRLNTPLKGAYYSVGGRGAKYESLQVAAMRKAKEELNLTINPKKLVFGGVIDQMFYGQRHNINIFYGYKLSPKTRLRLDSQHSHYKWFYSTDPRLHPFIKQKIRNTLRAIKNHAR